MYNNLHLLTSNSCSILPSPSLPIGNHGCLIFSWKDLNLPYISDEKFEKLCRVNGKCKRKCQCKQKKHKMISIIGSHACKCFCKKKIVKIRHSQIPKRYKFPQKNNINREEQSIAFLRCGYNFFPFLSAFIYLLFNLFFSFSF